MVLCGGPLKPTEWLQPTALVDAKASLWRGRLTLGNPQEPPVSIGSNASGSWHSVPCSSRYVEARKGPPNSSSNSVVTVCAIW